MTEERSRCIKFGARLRLMREAKGLSQEQLAELASLHRTYVGSVERGERNPTLLILFRLAGALKIPLSTLVEGLD